jgi:hypothetical protein
MSTKRLIMAWLALGLLVAAAGCAKREMVVELSGTVMYEKPEIQSVSHTLTDARREGGSVRVTIAMAGDPGLQASFDIAPGIANRVAMTETTAGSYSGDFTFPPETVGGPFTILGRLFHEKAGEVVLRDPVSVTIPLLADTY